MRCGYLPRLPDDPPRAYGLYPGERAMLVVGSRRDTWNVGLVFPKGGYEQLRDAGLAALRRAIGDLAPWLADRTDAIADWKQTSLLVVQAGRLRRWYRPGLLLIGDAAHVMSPVYGGGINYAIQDAIVASNRLAPRLRPGDVRERDLAAVQRRRVWPTRLMQFMQNYGEQTTISGPLSLRQQWTLWLLDLRPCGSCARD
jgi:2-polyprenyl-6-methoxyphenol hydroxylase-like FAD-dependent oxidoreductase